MISRIVLLTMLCLATALPVGADGISTLAACTSKVFVEISRTRTWSGKPPHGCTASIAVEKRPGGIFVAAWASERTEGGWTMSAFSGAMDYVEIADKKDLVLAGTDLTARAVRLERCLNSIRAYNDPLECRDRSTTSSLVGERFGNEVRGLVWLDDTGRHAVVEYAFGSDSSTPPLPADLFNGEFLRPGTVIDLHR
jgi:hypothetical protein